MKRELYKSSDYAGLITRNGQLFYYGYERTKCQRHGTIDEECKLCVDTQSDPEWCFVVFSGKEELWRCGTSTIERAFPKTFLGPAPAEAYLLAGIGLWLEIIRN